jgi:putative hydrolase of the HAD superfamily
VGRAVLWDFDGTLAARTGMWSGCLGEALDAVLPGHGVPVSALRPGLRGGFPWHTPDVGHSYASADAWWAALTPLLARAVCGAGVGEADSARVAAAFRARYLDPSRWTVFPDVVPALSALSGWTHVVVSNHVPELPALVSALGLDGFFSAVVTSAAVGWEKPRPEIYAAGLRAAGDPDVVWMVGDNVVADVRGAEAAGIPAILVRTSAPDVARQAASLAEVVTYVAGS